MLDTILGILGVILLIFGVIIMLDDIKERNLTKSFAEGFGMVVFGAIIVMAWIKILLN